jgi:hypothetical protein
MNPVHCFANHPEHLLGVRGSPRARRGAESLPMGEGHQRFIVKLLFKVGPRPHLRVRNGVLVRSRAWVKRITTGRISLNFLDASTRAPCRR